MRFLRALRSLTFVIALRLGRRVFVVQTSRPWKGMEKMPGRAWTAHIGLVLRPDHHDDVQLEAQRWWER